MKGLNFNIHAFAAPQTKAEYLALAQEASRVLDEIGQLITARERDLERRTTR